MTSPSDLSILGRHSCSLELIRQDWACAKNLGKVAAIELSDQHVILDREDVPNVRR
jgi:hypothetical protein